MVETIDGPVPIEDIGVGTYVLGYNEETGEIGYYPVTDLISHLDFKVVYLTIDGEVIVTTAEHPFYTAEGEWVDAIDLRVGDEIRTAEWTTGVVESVYEATRPQAMYNFTVDTAHTYFVGGNQWLVHNTEPCGEIAFGIGDHLKSFAESRNLKTYWNFYKESAHTTTEELESNLINMMTGADHIHFNLDGMDIMGTYDEITELGSEGLSRSFNTTNWELYYIRSHPETLLKKTTFYTGEINEYGDPVTIQLGAYTNH